MGDGVAPRNWQFPSRNSLVKKFVSFYPRKLYTAGIQSCRTLGVAVQLADEFSRRNEVDRPLHVHRFSYYSRTFRNFLAGVIVGLDRIHREDGQLFDQQICPVQFD